MLAGWVGSAKHSKSRVVPRSGAGTEEYLRVLEKELYRKT